MFVKPVVPLYIKCIIVDFYQLWNNIFNTLLDSPCSQSSNQDHKMAGKQYAVQLNTMVQNQLNYERWQRISETKPQTMDEVQTPSNSDFKIPFTRSSTLAFNHTLQLIYNVRFLYSKLYRMTPIHPVKCSICLMIHSFEGKSEPEETKTLQSLNAEEKFGIIPLLVL